MQADDASNPDPEGAPVRHPAPFLIALPRGLVVSGITTWAVRLVGALAAAGRAVGLVVHRASAGHEPLHPKFPAGVRVFDCTGLPDLDSAAGDLTPFIPAYAHAVRTLGTKARRPVVLSPNHLGDCYGIAAALCQNDPATVRVLGYQHLLIPYDTHVLTHYEPAITRFVGVSDAITRALREAMPHRVADVRNIPYGVVVPDKVAQRPAAGAGKGQRALRLIYTGRLEHDQKRVRALLELSGALARRGVAHRLTLVGDGPAAAEIDALGAPDPAGVRSVVRLAPVGPDQVARLLDEHDIFVLASRAEGLSVSLLEAMARGCVPVVTRTPSGTDQAVASGQNGVVVDVPPDADDAAVGELLGAAVQRAAEIGLERLSHAAWHTAGSRFSLGASVAMTAHLIDECADTAPRAWPTQRPVAFTSAGGVGGSGAVPPDGAARLRDLLRRLAGRSVILHGTGRHTLELAGVLAESPARILAFTDDDPQRHGRSLWNWPILPPTDAASTGATDVVLSSWMNQETIWQRRGVYERQGLVVHRLYPDAAGDMESSQ